MKIVALDPGRTTGYAMGHIDDHGKMIVATGQHEWKHSDLLQHLKWYEPDVIVCESFDFRRSPKYQRDKVDLFSRELIGVVELYITMAENCTLHMQKPATVLGRNCYFTDRKLKEDKIYKPAKPHANDAARHLLYWFTFGPGYKYNMEGYQVGS